MVGEATEFLYNYMAWNKPLPVPLSVTFSTANGFETAYNSSLRQWALVNAPKPSM